MATKKKDPYAQTKAMMKTLGMSKDEIAVKIQEYKDLEGWQAITLRELMNMTEQERKELKSYCWHDGEPRCETIGIVDVNIRLSNPKDKKNPLYNVSWSDSDGDPDLYNIALDDKIKNIGDGTWNYGLFRKA